jgi:hypothetical protein
MPRLFGDISEEQNEKFKFLKGLNGSKTNGEALGKIIDKAAEKANYDKIKAEA